MKTNLANKIRSNLLLTIDKELKSTQIHNYFKLNDDTIKESVHIEFKEIFTCKQDLSPNDDLCSSTLSINDTISNSSISNSLFSHNKTQATSRFHLFSFSSLDKSDSIKQNIFKLKSFCTSLKASHPLKKTKAKRRNEISKTNKVNNNLLSEFKQNIKHQHRGSFAYIPNKFSLQNPFR